MSEQKISDSKLQKLLDDEGCIGVGGLYCTRLEEIINTMDVPSGRKNDPRWLARNLGFRNRNHPDYNEAINLIKALLGPTA